jgi:hypothetical protein
MSDVIDQAAEFVRSYYAEQGIKIRSAHAHAAVAHYLGFNSKIALKSDPNFDSEDQNLITYRKTELELLRRHIPKMKSTPLQALDAAELGQAIRAGLTPACQACSAKTLDVQHFAGDDEHPHGWLCANCGDGFSITFAFEWQKHTPAFPERVAYVVLNVAPARSLPEDILQRLVFVLPEFWEQSVDARFEVERMRVDSANFNRVTAVKQVVDSTRTQRNVLSYHLVNNAWHGTVFHYSGAVERQQYEAMIEAQMRKNIISAVVRYLAGSLPDSRLLSPETHREYLSYLPAHAKATLI